MKKLIVVLSSFLLALPAIGQEADNSSKGSLNVSVDVVSRYVWRGLLYDHSPNIQPTLSYTYGGFSVGSWASYGISNQYAEIDLFASYTKGPLTFLLYDYYYETETDLQANDYFNYKNKTTVHLLEGSVFYTGEEAFPIKLTAALFFYGLDKKANGDQAYSSYFEVGYPFKVADQSLDFFIGGSPTEGGFYHTSSKITSTDPNIFNLGVSTTKELKISDSFKLPVKATLSINPAAEDIFFVVAMTF